MQSRPHRQAGGCKHSLSDKLPCREQGIVRAQFNRPLPYLGPATGLELELKVNEESKLGNPEILPALLLLLIQ